VIDEIRTTHRAVVRQATSEASPPKGELNLNVHIHALVIDGVFAHDGQGCALSRLAA
jgi:hypothetical protein